VGTLLLDNGAGQLLDLFASGDIRSGLIGGYRELRDDLLVDAQAQLDELAHALASALSERQISGGAVSLGAQDGFDVDLAALLPGDEVSITYTQTPPGQTHTVTVVRVEDASLLPLDNALTADPGDTVIGIDFSAGIGAAAAALGAALGGSFSVSNPSGDTLRVLDDGAAGTIDISQLTARVTATGTADQGLGLALFTDGPGGAVYTNALDGGAQKIGFAGRIAVNPAVRADSSTLVVYSTSPPTPPGDQSRPLELLTRLTETPVGFMPTGGLGSASSPLVTSIDGYARELIVLQTGRAAAAEAESNAQTAVTATIEQRFSDESGVDVDQELARLIVLQSAYSANARVISVIQELLDLLVRV
jgi:flagellar hook-associated protein 1 FlgK